MASVSLNWGSGYRTAVRGCCISNMSTWLEASKHFRLMVSAMHPKLCSLYFGDSHESRRLLWVIVAHLCCFVLKVIRPGFASLSQSLFSKLLANILLGTIGIVKRCDSIIQRWLLNGRSRTSLTQKPAGRLCTSSMVHFSVLLHLLSQSDSMPEYLFADGLGLMIFSSCWPGFVFLVTCSHSRLTRIVLHSRRYFFGLLGF